MQNLSDFELNLRYFDHPPPHKSTDLVLFSLNQGTVYTFKKKRDFQAFTKNRHIIWTFFPKKGPNDQIFAFWRVEGILTD